MCRLSKLWSISVVAALLIATAPGCGPTTKKVTKKKTATAESAKPQTGMKTLEKGEAPASFPSSADGLLRPVSGLQGLNPQITYDEKDPNRPIVSLIFPPQPGITDDNLSHINGIRTLEWLGLNSSQVAGPGLVNIQGMTALKRIDMHGCRSMTDEGLAHITNLPNLEWVIITHSLIDGSGLKFLKNLPKLRYLNLTNSKITGPGLDELADCPALDSLWLSGAPLRDEGLANLKNLKQLKFLYLNDTLVSGPGLENLKDLSNLQLLDLQNTGIKGPSLAPLAGIIKLKTLDVSGTHVGDEDLKTLSGFQLTWLGIKTTKVTPDGAEKLKKDLPSTNIEY